MLVGIAVEAIGLVCHARANAEAAHEGAASHYVQTTKFGKTYLVRNGVMAAVIVAMVVLLLMAVNGTVGIIAWGVVAVVTLGVVLVGRALFYVLVVPTTMPGAFFWRNKGFEEHARDIGLAGVVDMGVVESGH